jgi:hypothetical protein
MSFCFGVFFAVLHILFQRVGCSAHESNVAITILSKFGTIMAAGDMTSGLSVMCVCARYVVLQQGRIQVKLDDDFWLKGDSKPRTVPGQTGRVRSRMSRVTTMGQASG